MKLYRKTDEVEKVNNEKYHVFFRRVSTAGQDLAMQIQADEPFRGKLLANEIKVFNENAISANKLSVKERPEMNEVILLIKQGKVHTLYAFDRTRLYRDSYEAQAFHDLLCKYDVQLVFTSVGNGNIQATEDPFLEGLLNIFSDIEGKNIARRTKEAQRMYPAKKLGYEKIKQTKQYHKDPSNKELLEDYFSSLLEISTINDLGELLLDFHKKLKRPEEKLISIACDPFYAGYDLSKGENKLQHVEAYLNLKDFYDIQEKLGELFESYIERIEKLNNQNYFKPICSYCLQPMHYRIDKLNNVGFYSCSRNHAKNRITTFDLSNAIQMVMQSILQHLDSKKLLNHSIKRFREIRNELEQELSAIEKQLNELKVKLVLYSDHYSSDWKDDTNYKKMTLLKDEKIHLLKELSKKESLLHHNEKLVKSVEDYLQDNSKVNPAFLYTMLIKELYVHQNEIDLKVAMFDYLTDIEKEFIYQGDVIA